jgi:Holliday junction DNA helicase RuvA
MYAYIKGQLIESNSTYAVVDAGGVGFKIFTPSNAFGRLPKAGGEVVLHTAFVVREQAQTLYGFLSAQERDFFEALLGVTGIGPKTALALVGHLSLMELQRAIANEDTGTLCRVPGLGKKGAERLIMEMRDKVGAGAFSPSDLAVHFQADPRAQSVNDAMSALINLGYNQVTAQKAIKKTLKDIPEGIDVAELIAYALKHV